MTRARALFVQAALFLTTVGAQDSRIEALQRAAAQIEQQHPELAEKTLAPLLRASSNTDAVALNLLGLVRIAQNRPAEAETLFRQAIASGHPIAGPHINLARLYAQDRATAAVAELSAALQISPGNPQAQTLLRLIATATATAAQRTGNLPPALAILSKARELIPHDPEILYDFGLIALEAAQLEEAAAALQDAHHLRPADYNTVYALARVHLAQNEATLAEQEMRQYLASRPDDPTAQYGLGYILMAQQKPDEAQPFFEKSLALKPEQTESAFQLGEIALSKGDALTARSRFQDVVNRDPLHAGALTELGLLAYREGSFDAARNYCRQAVSSSPTYQKAQYYLALTLSKLGRKSEADQHFELSRQLQKKR